MKLVPPVALIEAALENMGSDPNLSAPVKELGALGLARQAHLRMLTPKLTQFSRGYLLGLETARLAISARVDVIMAKIDL